MPEGRKGIGLVKPTFMEEIWKRMVALDKHIKQLEVERATLEAHLMGLEANLKAMRIVLKMDEEAPCPKGGTR